MAISGRIAQASRLGLEDLLERKLLEEQIASSEQQRALNNQMREREQTFRESEAVAGREESAAARRSAANVQGLAEHHRQRGIWEQEEGGRKLEGALRSVHEDPSIPGEYKQLLQLRQLDPKVSREDIESPEDRMTREMAKEDADVRRAGRMSGAQAREAARYRDRSSGSPQWVVGSDGAPSYRVPQPGDKPHDPVAARQQGGAAGGPSPYAEERGARMIDSVDELLPMVNQWTTGPGSLMAQIPGTDARDFSAALDKLKANVAFNELTEMREASKTGGALGQVSNVELRLLESARGALDPGQSPAQFRKQLQQIKDSVQRWEEAKQQYGGPGAGGGGGAQEPQMAPSHGGGGPSMGEVRTINGTRARWDGKGWLPVK